MLSAIFCFTTLASGLGCPDGFRLAEESDLTAGGAGRPVVWEENSDRGTGTVEECAQVCKAERCTFFTSWSDSVCDLGWKTLAPMRGDFGTKFVTCIANDEITDVGPAARLVHILMERSGDSAGFGSRQSARGIFKGVGGGKEFEFGNLHCTESAGGHSDCNVVGDNSHRPSCDESYKSHESSAALNEAYTTCKYCARNMAACLADITACAAGVSCNSCKNLGRPQPNCGKSFAEKVGDVTKQGLKAMGVKENKENIDPYTDGPEDWFDPSTRALVSRLARALAAFQN